MNISCYLQIWGGSNALKKIGIDLFLGDPFFAAIYLTVPALLAGASFGEAAAVLRSQIGRTLILNYQVTLRKAHWVPAACAHQNICELL